MVEKGEVVEHLLRQIIENQEQSHVGLINIKTDMREHFEAMDKRFEAIDRRFEDVDKRFEAIDRRFEDVDKRFEAIDRRFEDVNRRFDAIDLRFNLVEHGLLALNRELADFRREMTLTWKSVIYGQEKLAVRVLDTEERLDIFDELMVREAKEEE